MHGRGRFDRSASLLLAACALIAASAVRVPPLHEALLIRGAPATYGLEGRDDRIAAASAAAARENAQAPVAVSATSDKELNEGLGPDSDYGKDALLTVSTEDGMLVGDLRTNLVSVERYRHDVKDWHSGSDDSEELMDGMLMGDLRTRWSAGGSLAVERYQQHGVGVEDWRGGSDESEELMDCDDVQDVSSEVFWDELSVALASGAGDDGVLFEEGWAAGLPPQLFEEASSTESSSWITVPLPSDSLLDALIWSNLRGDALQTAEAMPAMRSASWLPSGLDAGGADLERLSGFAVLATAWLFIGVLLGRLLHAREQRAMDEAAAKGQEGDAEEGAASPGGGADESPNDLKMPLLA